MQADRPPVLHPQKGPSASAPEGPAPAVLVLPAAANARLAGARVLVVEDDNDSRELICALIQRAGAMVMCVASVAQAMEVYRSFDPDVVLTDFSMPGADGFDLIREFRKAPSTRAVAVPILVLSGHSEDNWHAHALAAGAADVLIKPFDPPVLIAWIAAALVPGRSERA